MGAHSLTATISAFGGGDCDRNRGCRGGRQACSVIWNAEVKTERAKLLCRIKFKERGEGYHFELKMVNFM